MADLFASGFETPVTAENDAGSITGTASVQSTIKRSGGFAFRANPTTTAVGWIEARPSVATAVAGAYAADNAYHTGYMYVETAPGSGDEEVYVCFGAGAVRKFSVRLDDSGVLRAFAADGTTQVGSDTSFALSAQTWYRLDILVGRGGGSSAPWEVHVYNDPGPGFTPTLIGSISGTGTLGNIANAFFVLGKHTNRNGQTIDVVFDDWTVSDSAFRGPHQVLALHPNANGSTQEFSAGTNASDYQEVDEVTPDDATYVESLASGAPNFALFGYESCASAGIPTGSTLHAVHVVTRVREGGSSVTNAAGVRALSGATTSDSSTNNPTATVRRNGRFLTLDPATSAAWTEAGIDALEAGVYENNNVALRCTYAALMVSFTAPLKSRTTLPIRPQFYTRRRVA
jgi:hypothetical protein